MIFAIWAIVALVPICRGMTLPLSDSISNPQSSNATDAFLPIPQNLSITGHGKDNFVVPDTYPVIKGVVAWPMPRVTFTKMVVETCINLLIQILKKFPGDTFLVGPEWTECEPLKITLWPANAYLASINHAEGIAVSSALIKFIANSDSYGNIYIYVFRGVVNIATINMENVVAPNLGGNVTTSGNLTSDTNLDPSSILSNDNPTPLDETDQFIIPNTNPQLKGVVAWPTPRFILDKDNVTKVVRALAARMKSMSIHDIVPGPENEIYSPLSLTLNPVHNIGSAPWMTYWEAAIVLTFFNQYMAHAASYGNFYVYIFRDSDCIGTINLQYSSLSSNSTSDTNEVSVT